NGTSTPWNRSPATRAANRCADRRAARAPTPAAAGRRRYRGGLAAGWRRIRRTLARTHARARARRPRRRRARARRARGPRRFLPPLREPAWRGVREAAAYGASAPQRGGGGPGSEDCLFLNVWTPALRDGARRPVLVYLHGGGYTTGSGSDPLYDGTRLCLRGDVVVVTLNHRLNAFGYLHLADLLGRDYAASGNVGQLDLVQALRWVREHAEEFGGDPGNVTVFGQSGGGAKIATLMAMPAAAGLFQRAWTMSGQQVTA